MKDDIFKIDPNSKIKFLPAPENSSFIRYVTKEQAKEILDTQKNRIHLTGTPKIHMIPLTEINGLQAEKATFLKVKEPSNLYDQIKEKINNPKIDLETNSFSALCGFINLRKINEIIYRKDIILYVQKRCPGNSNQNVDNYRNYMTKAGYLKWLSNGTYQKLKELPSDYFSVSQLVREAYPNRKQ